MPTDNRYISRRALLVELGISRQTLNRWMKYRSFPRPLERSGLTPIYRQRDVDAWFDAVPIEKIILETDDDDCL